MPPQPDDHAPRDSMRPANGAGDSGPRVLDAEVLGPEDEDGASGRGPAGGRGGGAGAQGPGGSRAGHWGAAGNTGDGRFYRMGATFGSGGGGFGRVWTASGANGAGCLSPCITFALFFVCLSQFGVLAALGFAIFHLVGSIAGSIRSMRLLVEGRRTNPWTWRLGNWFVSFMLTVWLAGGFNG